MRSAARRARWSLALVAVLASCAPAGAVPPVASLDAVVGAYDASVGGAGTRLPQLLPTDLVTARRLARNGETDSARQVFEALLGRDASDAAAARLGLALLALDDGRPADAATQLQALVRDYPDRPERAPATYLLGIAAWRLGDTEAARARLEEYLRLDSLLAAYVHLQLADLGGDARGSGARTREAEQALAAPAARRLRIEALERLANAAAEAGDLAGAQARWEAIWPLAATTSYRAEVLWQLASLARRRGDLDGAANRYLTLVTDYPTTRRAAAALGVLNELDRSDPVTYLQAGLVRFHQGEYGRALTGFETQLALGGSGDEQATAAYYRAVALARQGRESAAIEAYRDVAASYPASPLAPTAFYQVARIQEEGERFSAAAINYAAAASLAPASEAGQLARFREGFALYRAGRADDALAAWEAALPQLAGGRVTSTLLRESLDPRAALLFWRGKLLADRGRSEEARRSWELAAAAAPSEYYGVRAKAVLADARRAAGDDGRASGAAADARARAFAVPAADAALAAWLGADPTTLAAELRADPAWRRGAALWELGRADEAAWEFDDLRARFTDQPARLYTLGSALRDLGADHVALAVGEQLYTAGGVTSVADLPAAVRTLVFPAPYIDLVIAQAARWSIDPALLYALMRQESAFNPRAQSSADARGLAQVIPSTAREIARALGRGGITTEELFKPAVSIELGAYYLGQALQQFRGNVHPALAGYNAGPGAAASWLRRPGGSDPDLYAEQIPYAETATYVRRVYVFYRLYADVYNPTP